MITVVEVTLGGRPGGPGEQGCPSLGVVEVLAAGPRRGSGSPAGWPGREAPTEAEAGAEAEPK